MGSRLGLRAVLAGVIAAIIVATVGLVLVSRAAPRYSAEATILVTEGDENATATLAEIAERLGMSVHAVDSTPVLVIEATEPSASLAETAASTDARDVLDLPDEFGLSIETVLVSDATGTATARNQVPATLGVAYAALAAGVLITTLTATPRRRRQAPVATPIESEVDVPVALPVAEAVANGHRNGSSPGQVNGDAKPLVELPRISWRPPVVTREPA
jgi:hypothetical protein